jgi:hypothetical protein
MRVSSLPINTLEVRFDPGRAKEFSAENHDFARFRQAAEIAERTAFCASFNGMS